MELNVAIGHSYRDSTARITGTSKVVATKTEVMPLP